MRISCGVEYQFPLEAEEKMSEDDLNKLRAEARFFRAYAYARLITLWGDVPFYLKDITPEEAFLMGRTDKKEVLKQIYEDYDFAAEHLPVAMKAGHYVFRLLNEE